ncbi:DNA methyltransferase [Castellaniella sp.]|uniref:DNA methyltransferase n=1 Tax=Castellaniella sp. TaxID=1955812 RepID=UPI002AFEE071|nr:DNA methyltransferase [Castellaniella sp.]
MSRIIQGNCLDIMPTFPDRCVDLVLTDPPYLVNYKDRSGRTIEGDKEGSWLIPAFQEVHRVLRQNTMCISFYGWNQVDQFSGAWRAAGFRVVGHIVFAKPYASKSRFLRYQHESAYLLAKGMPDLPDNPPSDVMPWQYSGNRFHPTQKPVSILSTLIETFSKPRDIVLDPFAGSGSTGVAALQTGRRFVGIELDRKYHAAAEQRITAIGWQGRGHQQERWAA